MKNLKLFIPVLALLVLSIGLISCQSQKTEEAEKVFTAEPTKAEETDEDKEPGKITISQVFPDGSEKLLMELNESEINEIKKDSEDEPSVVPGVKGIAITSDGFLPAEITIKAGTKVIFQNLDEAPHQPASDIHPTHTLCPGFDSLGGLAKDENYEHTFTKPGECSFHDHLNPGLKGKIIIE